MQMIEEARHWWRFASVRLAAVAGLVASWAATDPQGFVRLVGMLPEWARPALGLVVFAAPVLARLMRQDVGKGAADGQ